MFIRFTAAPERGDDEEFIPFVPSDDCNHAVGNGQEWFREVGESERSFLQRILDSLPLRRFLVGLQTLKEGATPLKPIGCFGAKTD